MFYNQIFVSVGFILFVLKAESETYFLSSHFTLRRNEGRKSGDLTIADIHFNILKTKI